MKLTKRILAAVTAASCAFCINFAGWERTLIVNAIDYSDPFKYGDYLSYKKIDEDNDGIYDYIEISDCDESAVSVEIPNEIDGLPVKSIEGYAFSGCSSLISMEIPDSITSIGDCAFLNCSSLASVTIPESVISIEFATFRGCSSLESITIPDSVTNIGNWAFRDCSSLTSIEIPNNVTSIGNSAFEGCSSLTSINVSENNKDYSSIDGILFNKDKTELIKYPESKEITEYIVPDSVIYIDSLAFSGCSSLTSVTIPDSVTSMGWAFSGSSSLTSINVSENNKDYSSIDGILFNKDKTLLIRYPQSSEITEYIVPNSVICIEDDAFSDCSSLTSVTILDSVTVIRYGAFFGCSSLESITIPDGVSTIDNSTFCNCTNLESITIENPKCEIFDALLTICNGRDDQTGDYYFNGTIYGYKDSTAQAYAEKYGRKFAEIDRRLKR